MEKIKEKEAIRYFDETLYDISILYITSDRFWDGGIHLDSSLKEKVAFYTMTEKMSAILKSILSVLDEPVYIGKPLCEYGDIYAPFSGLKKFETFRTIHKTIGNRKCYALSLPEDDEIIDLIVESNFRYFSFISFFLPQSNIIFRPSCHTEILVYTENKQKVLPILESAVEQFSDESQRICVKQ